MSAVPSGAYGLLLTFDGYGVPRAVCRDAKHLQSVLKHLPGLIGMRRLSRAHVVRVREQGIAGLSGFTFIMESHVSVHTYEERGFVTADIYSCKPFDTDAAARFLGQMFGTSSFETNIVTRGLRFNEAIPPSSGPHARL